MITGSCYLNLQVTKLYSQYSTLRLYGIHITLACGYVFQDSRNVTTTLIDSVGKIGQHQALQRAHISSCSNRPSLSRYSAENCPRSILKGNYRRNDAVEGHRKPQLNNLSIGLSLQPFHTSLGIYQVRTLFKSGLESGIVQAMVHESDQIITIMIILIGLLERLA